MDVHRNVLERTSGRKQFHFPVVLELIHPVGGTFTTFNDSGVDIDCHVGSNTGKAWSRTYDAHRGVPLAGSPDPCR